MATGEVTLRKQVQWALAPEVGAEEEHTPLEWQEATRLAREHRPTQDWSPLLATELQTVPLASADDLQCETDW